MRKIACHRIYMKQQIIRTATVITIHDNGTVIGYNPLEEESANTEWIGGVVVISDQPDLRVTDSFKMILEYSSDISSKPVYAWHINPFDFQREDITDETQIIRLV